MNAKTILIAAALPVFAHDLYLMPKPFRLQPGGSVAIAFHNGDDFPEPDRPPRLENILDAVARSKAGQAPFENLRVSGKLLLAEVKPAGTGTAVLSVRTRPNLIELAPASFEGYLKHEGLEHVIEWRAKNGQAATAGRERYSKYVKSLVTVGSSDDFFLQPAGFPIEIIPESDPSRLKPGDNLAIRVLFRGQGAEGLQIETAWLPPDGTAERKAAGRTDRDGRFEVSIGSRGIWKLHTVLMERCQEPHAADWESFWTSLTFEIQ